MFPFQRVPKKMSEKPLGRTLQPVALETHPKKQPNFWSLRMLKTIRFTTDRVQEQMIMQNSPAPSHPQILNVWYIYLPKKHEK